MSSNDPRSDQLALVDHVQDYAIFMLDPHGLVATWNRGAERIKGYRADEIIGRHFGAFYTPEGIAQSHPAHELEVALRGGAVRGGGLARAQGRVALLGQCRHHERLRPGWQARRLRQGHARPHRAPGASAGAPALQRGPPAISRPRRA